MARNNIKFRNSICVCERYYNNTLFTVIFTITINIYIPINSLSSMFIICYSKTERHTNSPPANENTSAQVCSKEHAHLSFPAR